MFNGTQVNGTFLGQKYVRQIYRCIKLIFSHKTVLFITRNQLQPCFSPIIVSKQTCYQQANASYHVKLHVKKAIVYIMSISTEI